MFELLRLAIALIGTFASGVWDLKTTDVPDKVVFPMIGSGVLLGVIEGVLTGNWLYLAGSMITAFIFTAFAVIMYFTGAWGGGDGALLVAVGALLPFWPFASVFDMFPFPLAYFVSVFAVGLVYSVLYLTVTMYRQKRARILFSREFSKVSVAYVPLMVVMVLLVPLLPALFSFSLAVVLLAVPPVFALSNAADRFFYRPLPSKELRPGDMIGEDIPKLKIYKQCIRGLTEKDIKAIRKLKKSVLIRSGVRYGIVFFLALLPFVLSAHF